MTSSIISSVASLISAFVGMSVVSTKEGNAGQFKVAKLDTKIGTMKSGEKAEYVVLQSEENGEVRIISLHPNIASKLFKTGEVDGYKMVQDAALQTEGETEIEKAFVAAFNQPIVPVVEVKVDSTEPETVVDEITEVVAVKVKKAKKEKVVVAKVKKEKVETEVTEPKVTHKTQATQIFEEELAKQGNVITKQLRAPVIARFKAELMMGIPGSSTYYQNCKKAHA